MTVKVGLGLPICDSRTLLTWARRVDSGPFSSIGLLDRLVYHNPGTLRRLWAGEPFSQRAGAIGPSPVQPGGPEAIKIFSDIGADEVMLFCWSDRLEQIDRLADLVP